MNKDHHSEIHRLLRSIRSRWRWLVLCRGAIRAALGAAVIIATGLLLAGLAGRMPTILAIVAVATVVLGLVVIAWGFLPARRVPTDARLARYIEERSPALE